MINKSMEEDLRDDSKEKISRNDVEELHSQQEIISDDIAIPLNNKELVKDDYSGDFPHSSELPGAEKDERKSAENNAEKKESSEKPKDPVASLVESPAMLALQKNLRSVQQKRKGMKDLNFPAAILVVLLIILCVSFFQKKLADIERMETPAAGLESTAHTDPFADVKNRNDAARMRSVTIIAETLAVYHLEEKADLPISSAYVKLNHDNPVSELMKDALKRYGKDENILRDPDGDDNYYAYRSEDGLSFELSTKLEDWESYDCSSEPCIFRKVMGEKDFQIMAMDLEQYK